MCRNWAGRQAVLDTTIIGLLGRAVWFGLYLAAILVISELKKLYERERSLSRLDSLTHIANRRALLESAAAALSSAKRRRTTISLAYYRSRQFQAFE